MTPQVWTGVVLQSQPLALLEDIATVTTSTMGESEAWYGEAMNADVIFVRGSTFVTGEVMDHIGPRLRLIVRTGIGVDRVDLAAATERGIMVINTPDGPTESTAEHAVALILNLCKQVVVGDRRLRSGRPFPPLTELMPGLEVAGAVLGLIGLGRIGTRVAAIAQVLGMKVLAYDPFIDPARATDLGVELLPDLATLLPRAQVISLHCPAMPETHHIINAETLNLMSRGSYLINVARGALIDHDALFDALQSGQLAGAGLDVFDPEPPIANHPLFSLSNTICTPHIGSYTTAGLFRMQMMACEQVVSALCGERPVHLVNAGVWGHQRF
jgi:D-3-phosphoglycerate dehydrogenase / 2-oxoglutarate reductase